MPLTNSMVRLTVLIGLSALSLPSPSTGQVVASGGIETGMRVRAWSPTISPLAINGRVLAVGSRTIGIEMADGCTLDLDPLRADSLWIFTGTKGNSRKGAIVGGVIGFVIGVVWGATSDPGDLFTPPRALLSGIGGLMIGGAGALVGAGVGESFRKDVWVAWSPPFGRTHAP
jgi:hypothetical protein